MSREALTWDIHPISSSFPALLGEARDGMKASIDADGVGKPITAWKDAQGKTWIVDGRTRRELYAELVAEGRIDPDAEPMPVEYIEATSEAEMIGRIARMQIHHRNLNRFQTACMVMKVVALERAAAKQKPRKDKDGKFLDQKAAQYGVTHTYIYDAAKLLDKSPDLFEEVLAGDKNMSEAMSEYNHRFPPKTPKPAKKAGASGSDNGTAGGDTGGEAGGEPGSNGAATNGAAAEPPVLVDEAGNTLPEEFVEVFAARNRVKEMIGSLNRLKKEVKDLIESPAGVHLPGQEIASYFTNIVNLLKKHQPHAICPTCAGEGVIQTGETTPSGKPRTKKCDVCDRTGFLDEVTYEVAARSEAQEDAAQPANA